MIVNKDPARIRFPLYLLIKWVQYRMQKYVEYIGRQNDGLEEFGQEWGGPKALKAVWKGSVLVSTVAPRAARATAPDGRGCRMMPVMVAAKMANRCQAWEVMERGGGRIHSRVPIPSVTSSVRVRSEGMLQPTRAVRQSLFVLPCKLHAYFPSTLINNLG